MSANRVAQASEPQLFSQNFAMLHSGAQLAALLTRRALIIFVALIKLVK